MNPFFICEFLSVSLSEPPFPCGQSSLYKVSSTVRVSIPQSLTYFTIVHTLLMSAGLVPGNYYFEVTAHSHPLGDECSCVSREAVTAGNSVGEGITIAQLETGSARQQWNLIRAQDDAFFVQSMSSPELYIGFNKLECGERFMMSRERQPFWLFWHPPPNGCGDRMLRLRHNKMAPVIVAKVNEGSGVNEDSKVRQKEDVQ
ncbi:unnamed protein product [Rhizoctonia solani]|uniref:Uncharacterized protein n=1 Tax=Rhizoctonia solani TaxID=456999 RepID=A0A8H2X928_9AGAM|nr:unnamed protein product [Rhizoctonia solani]